MKANCYSLACILIMLLGCGFSADGKHSIEGEVTVDGKPLEEGRILMRLQAGDKKAYFAKILQGNFDTRVPEGPYRVEIRASRPIPGKFDMSNGTPKQMGEMYIPKRFNRESELTMEVSSTGGNQFIFELTED